MLPEIVVDYAIASELEGALRWAARHDIDVSTELLAERILRVVLVQEQSRRRFFLQGKFDQYKALPPEWDWRDENWLNDGSRSLSPQPESTPFGNSMFIVYQDKAIICAPFNRLAFRHHGGPHRNWGDLISVGDSSGQVCTCQYYRRHVYKRFTATFDTP